MFSVELNIQSLSAPVVGGGWVAVSPDYEKSSLNKVLEDEQIFTRTRVQSNLHFSYEEFTALNTLRLSYAKIPLRVKHTTNDSTTEIVYTGELDLFGSYKENTCILKVAVSDSYTDLLDNEDEKVNILNTVSATKCDLILESSRLKFYDTQVDQSQLFYTWLPGFSPPPYYVYAREEITYPDHIANELNGTNDWEIISDNGDGTKTLGRTWSDGGFDPPIEGDFNKVPGDFSDYSINDYFTYLGEECTIIGIRGSTYGLLLRNLDYYDSAGWITYSRFRKLKSTIKEIVNQFDSSIQFDSDSWSYLDAHPELSFLLISNASDLIVVGDPPQERSEGQEFAELTFKKLMTILRTKLKLYWKLKIIDDVPYFRLIHRSEVNYVTGPIDLQDLNGKDWTRDEWRYNNTKLFNKLVRTTTWDNYDFRGTDILIPALDNIAKPKTEADDRWHFDIWDIVARGGNFYPNNTKNEFCMVAAEPFPTDEVEQLSIMNNNGYENFNYSGGVLEVSNTSGNASVSSNTITPVEGYTYRIILNLVSLTGQRPQIATVGGDLEFTDIQDGENIFYATETGIGSLIVVINNSALSTWRIEDMSIERYVFRVRVAEGKLTGKQLANAELSVANLDETHAQYELPFETVKINHNEVTLSNNQLLKNKEQETKAPLYKPSYLDEELLVPTNKGNLEFDSLKIPMNGGMPEFIGRFI